MKLGSASFSRKGPESEYFGFTISGRATQLPAGREKAAVDNTKQTLGDEGSRDPCPGTTQPAGSRGYAPRPKNKAGDPSLRGPRRPQGLRPNDLVPSVS